MQQFTGSIGADGASVSIESVTGLVQEGVLAENGSEIIANTTLETDPICLVSWVYEEEAGMYDVVLVNMFIPVQCTSQALQCATRSSAFRMGNFLSFASGRTFGKRCSASF